MYCTKWVLACELRQGLAALGQPGSRMLVQIDFMQSEHGHVSPANSQFWIFSQFLLNCLKNFSNAVSPSRIYMYLYMTIRDGNH